MRQGKLVLSFASIFNQGGKALLVSLVIVFCFSFFNYIRRAELFPVRSVKVFGVQHLARAEIKALTTPLVSHGFFNIDVDVIRDRFSQLSWVNEVAVRRHWPDRVEIVLQEKNAVATWNRRALLSDAGRVFVPSQTDFPGKLPNVIGPDGRQLYLLGYFNAINRLLRPLHAKIRSLELTAGDEWRLRLQNGVAVKMGSKDILTHLQHFVKVYPKVIGKKSANVEYVDLRYPSGMAVRWKSSV